MVNGTTEVDFIVENHGEVYLIKPQNHVARAFLMEHANDARQWIGGAVGVAPEHLMDLLAGLFQEGFEVQQL